MKKNNKGLNEVIEILRKEITTEEFIKMYKEGYIPNFMINSLRNAYIKKINSDRRENY